MVNLQNIATRCVCNLHELLTIQICTTRKGSDNCMSRLCTDAISNFIKLQIVNHRRYKESQLEAICMIFNEDMLECIIRLRDFFLKLHSCVYKEM